MFHQFQLHKYRVAHTHISYDCQGYVFCKMRICAETYEPLQQLPLCRSWMAGTVNQKGYKKLPPAPIALSDEEVAKFKGLEEQTDAMYDKYGEDYTGRGDDGMDLIDQYEGYRVENMVKILNGNFKGEDGIVRRLKDGMIMVRLYTYGSVMDQWFQPKDIRPMTDAEAMKGLTGPTIAVNQDEFDVSIGKKSVTQDLGGRGIRMAGGGGTRMRRQDRINRGERGNRDLFGRNEQEIKEEEENWRQFREEQRASQQQRRGDLWGIKERSSWDSGDDAAQYTEHGWKSGRQIRKEKKLHSGNSSESQNVQDAIDGGGSWDFFSPESETKQSEHNSKEEDDFFSSLMTELSDSMVEVEDDFMAELSVSLDETQTTKESNHHEKIEEKDSSYNGSNDDDFFNDLMSHLSDTLDDSREAKSEQEVKKESFDQNEKKSLEQEDDFFTDLMSQLTDINDEENKESNKDHHSNISEDDFFASLESDLNESLMESTANYADENTSTSGHDLNIATENAKNSDHSQSKSAVSSKPSLTESDLSSNTVASLKEMLKERGLKVSGKKSELISRLLEN